MAHFWGRIRGNRGEATRQSDGDSGLLAILASWSGAVQVHVYARDGEDMVRVTLEKTAGKGTEAVIYDGPLAPRRPT